MRYFLLTLALVVATPVVAKVIPLDWTQTARYYGRWRTVAGKVVATHKDKRYLYLHFHKDHKDHFTVVIHRKYWKRFPKKPRDYYQDEDVIVRGTIRRSKGRPVVFVSRRANLWVVGEKLARPH
jgi:hypothetical protein